MWTARWYLETLLLKGSGSAPESRSDSRFSRNWWETRTSATKLVWPSLISSTTLPQICSLISFFPLSWGQTYEGWGFNGYFVSFTNSDFVLLITFLYSSLIIFYPSLNIWEITRANSCRAPSRSQTRSLDPPPNTRCSEMKSIARLWSRWPTIPAGAIMLFQLQSNALQCERCAIKR